MTTKTLHVSEPAYAALTAHKRPGESFSDVTLRLAGSEEKSVCGFLQNIDPALRTEIAEAVTSAKKDLDHARPRKDSR
jgi:predicted CopG family antitoxin